MNYFLSKYTISIPLAEVALGRSLIHSTWSGDSVEISNEEMQLISKGQIQNLSEDTLQTLIESRILIADGTDELTEVISENVDGASATKSLYKVFMPSAGCQLACGDPSAGSYCGQTHSSARFSDETEDEIFHRIAAELQEGSFNTLTTGWFGGEPLLAKDRILSLSKRLITAAQRFSCKYESKVVTNGLLLTLETAKELFQKAGVKKVEVTLDGTKEYHDQRRNQKKTYRPTFDSILSNVIAVAKEESLLGLNITIRSNVDRRNIDGIIPLIDELAEAGLSKRIRYYVAPVHPWGNDVSSLSIAPKEFAIFELDVLAKMLDLGFEPMLLPSRKRVTCLALNPFADVVDPHGARHKCTEIPLVPAYVENGLLRISKKSKIEPGEESHAQSVKSLSEKSQFSSFNSDVLSQKFGCSDCRILPICGGACPLSWYQGHAPCPSIKYNIEERLHIKYLQSRVLTV
jgi:uncharacterized protein